MVPSHVTYVSILKNACHFVLEKRRIFFFSPEYDLVLPG